MRYSHFSSGSDFLYSSSRMRGGHIVAEHLPYRDRSGEAERVVQEL